MSVIRAFIAIELSAEIRRSLDRVSKGLRQQLQGVPVRWVPADNIHLTLKFLGNVSLANLDVLKKLIQSEASRYASFEFSVGDVGAFPSIRRPRVVMVHVQAPATLASLQRGLEEQSRRLGYEPERRPFTPHLTIGRVSNNASNAQIQLIGQTLETAKVGFLGAMQVQAVSLFQSDLQPSGAVYTCLYSADLIST
jgi:2'-5' RNA ligase